MENTTNLKLPLLVSNQSQKEVTHNEALTIIDNILQNGIIDKDLTTPPSSPNSNDLYIVGTSATNDWADEDGHLAYYDNGWRFLEAREGATFWVNDEDCLYTYNGSTWEKTLETISNTVEDLNDLSDVSLTSASQYDLLQHNGTNFINTKEVQNLSLLGINATADNTNKLSIKSDAILFDNATDDSQVKVNKASSTDTASHLFQTNYSGRAEFGLTGSDDFTLKVSSDGSTWNESFVVDNETGDIDFKGDITQNGSAISGNYELLQETTITDGDSYITFTGLNDGYKHEFDFFDLLSNSGAVSLLAVFINSEGDITTSNAYIYYNSCKISYNTDQNLVRTQSSTVMANLKISGSLYDSDMLSSTYPTYGSMSFYNRSISGQLIKGEESLFITDFTTVIKGNQTLSSSITGIRFYLSSGTFKAGKFKHYRIK
ncbi:MAG: DUF2793 domain-containing protein [Rickettsiales bacterium]|nr:DUF2793 domain-containing protein [Rickettsiales bacterium]